jgi:hypothetical protein
VIPYDHNIFTTMSLSDTGLALIICAVLFVVLCPCLVIRIARSLSYEEEDEKYESESGTSDDEPTIEKEEESPPIVLGNTESTEDEGVEASLSASSSDDKRDIEDQRQKKSEFRSAHAMSRSFDSSKQSQDTSSSHPGRAIDVHVCSSSYCEICQRRNGITFVSAQPLDPKMVDKLQAAPPRWWEFGESFFDLYQQANGLPRSDAQRKTNDEQSSICGRISRTKGSSKKSKRSLKYVASDGDDSSV